MDPISALAEHWRQEAETFRRYGDERGTQVCELHADELEAAVGAARLEAVTLNEARELGGYSYDRLWHLVKDGTLADVGESDAPRIRRCDVPVKPGHSTSGNGAAGFLEDVIATRQGRGRS